MNFKKNIALISAIVMTAGAVGMNLPVNGNVNDSSIVNAAVEMSAKNLLYGRNNSG